jgi:hypothetical protein
MIPLVSAWPPGVNRLIGRSWRQVPAPGHSSYSAPVRGHFFDGNKHFFYVITGTNAEIVQTMPQNVQIFKWPSSGFY